MKRETGVPDSSVAVITDLDTPDVPEQNVPAVPAAVEPAFTAPDPLPNRDDALAALLNAPTVREMDQIDPPVQRLPPARTGTTKEWAPEGGGQAYLVWPPLYARIIGEARLISRRGDVVVLPSDPRTLQDVTSGYLLPEDG